MTSINTKYEAISKAFKLISKIKWNVYFLIKNKQLPKDVERIHSQLFTFKKKLMTISRASAKLIHICNSFECVMDVKLRRYVEAF